MSCAARLAIALGIVVGLVSPGRRAVAQSRSDSTAPHAVVVDPTAAAVPSIDPLADPAEGTPRKTGTSVTPLLAPIPFHNSQIGWGLVLMAGLIHRFDADTTL